MSDKLDNNDINSILTVFIEYNKDLINDNKYDQVYLNLRFINSDLPVYTTESIMDLTGRFTDLLYENGINPLEHMTEMPAFFCTNSKLKQITIPKNIISIKNFQFSKNLEKIIFEPGTEHVAIEPQAFNYCRYLKEIVCSSRLWNNKLKYLVAPEHVNLYTD